MPLYVANPGNAKENTKADIINNKTSEQTVLRFLVEYKSIKLISPNNNEESELTS